MKSFLKFLYLNNFFRLSAYLSKFISIFLKKEKKSISFYNFFKKRKKHFDKELLAVFYRPKIFIFNHDFDSKKILNNIYNYENLFKTNEFTNDGHKKIYQSEHNLNEKKNFIDTAKKIENFVNENLAKIFSINKINLIKMWFVITNNLGVINKHSHFNSDLSGVLYLKVDNNNLNSGLIIFNPLEEIDVYRYDSNFNKIEKSIFKGNNYIFKPKNNDLIVFNSYLEHSVENVGSKTHERVSLPFDLIIKA